MAWTTPRTWTAAKLLSSQLNEQLRDNLDYLKSAFDGIQTVYARKGSSATDWTAVGTDIRTPTKSKLQICTGYVEFTNSSDTEAAVSVTFPVAYADRPIVIPFFNWVSVSAGMTLEVNSLTATGCSLQARKISGNGVLTYAVACLAIGDIP